MANLKIPWIERGGKHQSKTCLNLEYKNDNGKVTGFSDEWKR